MIGRLPPRSGETGGRGPFRSRQRIAIRPLSTRNRISIDRSESLRLFSYVFRPETRAHNPRDDTTILFAGPICFRAYTDSPPTPRLLGLKGRMDVGRIRLRIEIRSRFVHHNLGRSGSTWGNPSIVNRGSQNQIPGNQDTRTRYSNRLTLSNPKRLRCNSPIGSPVVREYEIRPQCPTEAAPFSPTSSPSTNLDSLKGAIRSGVLPVAMVSARVLPQIGEALNP